MNINYDGIFQETSLQWMCKARIVHQVLEASGCTPAIRKLDPEYAIEYRLEKEAKARIDQLKLPTTLKESPKILVKPFVNELLSWYRNYPFETRPILTPYGNIDVLKTTTALLEDETLDISCRFLIACCFCNDRYKRELLCQLDADDIKRCHDKYSNTRLKTPLSTLLLDRENNRVFDEICYEDSLKHAFHSGNDVAIKYYISNAFPEIVPADILIALMSNTRPLKYFQLLPSTYSLMFSKLNQAQQRSHGNSFAMYLLTALLQWPFQRFFEEALQSLIDDRFISRYVKLIIAVLHKVVLGYEDHDYKELFKMLVGMHNSIGSNTRLVEDAFLTKMEDNRTGLIETMEKLLGAQDIDFRAFYDGTT